MVFCTEFLDAIVQSHGTIRTTNTTYAAVLKNNTHPKTRCRKPYAATQHLMLLMMGVCTRNIQSWEYINKITLLHLVGISRYFIAYSISQATSWVFYEFVLPTYYHLRYYFSSWFLPWIIQNVIRPFSAQTVLRYSKITLVRKLQGNRTSNPVWFYLIRRHDFETN